MLVGEQQPFDCLFARETSARSLSKRFPRAPHPYVRARTELLPGQTSPRGPPVPTPTEFEQQDDTDQIFAIKTWRHLRASMIGFVLAIFIGVGFERSKRRDA